MDWLQGVRIDTASLEVFRAWLHGDKVHLFLLALEAAAGQKLSLEGLIAEDRGVEGRCREAFAAVKVALSCHLGYLCATSWRLGLHNMVDCSAI